MNIFLKISIVPILLITPFTLNSTDVFHSSKGLVKMQANLNTHIIPGDAKLGNTVLLVTAPVALENIHIVTDCEQRETVLYKKSRSDNQMIYVIQLSFPTSCDQENIRIGDKENIFTDTLFVLPLESRSKMEDTFMNTSSTELLPIMREENKEASGKTGDDIVKKLDYLVTLYKNLYTNQSSTTARDVLYDREDIKYSSPVAGYKIPMKDNIIPGAGRPYRRNTTDGIHHGWDVIAPFGTPVQALTKGKIIRIKNNWNWDDFNKLKRGNLTPDNELTNLDIFRGNQIWIQSMDGNVIFYSHLSRISPDIHVGSAVIKGDYLGNIGISGVPDKNYKGTHLHFEIQQNPFLEDKKNLTFLEIMQWDYVGEDMKRSEVIEKTREIFE